MDGTIVEKIEVIAREVKVLTPIEAQPANIFLDALDVFYLFLGRIGVIKAEVAACVDALVFLRNSKIKAECFGVANVEVAIGFCLLYTSPSPRDRG